MAMQDAEKFVQEVQENRTLQEKLSELGKEYRGDSGDMETVITQNILPIAAEMNCFFTVKEYLECLRGRIQHQEPPQRLSDDEMDQVVGGMGDIDMSGSGTGGDVILVDKHIEYNTYIIFPGADEDAIKKLLS